MYITRLPKRRLYHGSTNETAFYEVNICEWETIALSSREIIFQLCPTSTISVVAMLSIFVLFNVTLLFSLLILAIERLKVLFW